MTPHLGHTTGRRNDAPQQGEAPASPAAVEMAAPWKPQTGFHRALEISQRVRDFHISTADDLK
jgi:hypothetical protein